MSVAIKFTEKYFTTAEAAKKLGIRTDSVNKYCNSDPQRLKGEKYGHSWMIPESEVRRYLKEECHTGRPKNRPKRSA
jgi:hypothetical protein